MRARLLGLTLTTVLLFSGCSLLPGQDEPREVPAEATQPPQGEEDLARFYEQTLEWGGCRGRDGECAELEVPVDYEDPTGETMTIAVLRQKAKGSSKGSVVYNPGGPGAAGTDYAAYADYYASPAVRRELDFVSFDPRGTGDSSPVDCLDDEQLDIYLTADLTPDDQAEEDRLAEVNREFGAGCKSRSGDIAPHISTEDAARDLDVLRAALAESRLTYLGKSYGTYLGSVYAGLFPDKVGRFVLDGAIAPDLTAAEFTIGQATGFDGATRAWARDCADSGCSLGGTEDEVIASVQDLLDELDGQPLPGIDGLQLTESWAFLGIAQAMYDQGQWSTLTSALDSARSGDGQDLMQLGFAYAYRQPGGGYRSNIMEALYAVNCLDRPEPEGDERDAMVEEARQAAPIWGEAMAGTSGPCSEWPYEPVGEPAPIAAKGAAPILVVGTTGDPATPYLWAQQLHEQLESSALVTYEGDGHTAYMRQNDCVDKAVDAQLLRGEVPESDITCS